jgi:hypothetical protein
MRMIRADVFTPVQIFSDAYLLEHSLLFLVSDTYPHV